MGGDKNRCYRGARERKEREEERRDVGLKKKKTDKRRRTQLFQYSLPYET